MVEFHSRAWHRALEGPRNLSETLAMIQWGQRFCCHGRSLESPILSRVKDEMQACVSRLPISEKSCPLGRAQLAVLRGAESVETRSPDAEPKSRSRHSADTRPPLARPEAGRTC